MRVMSQDLRASLAPGDRRLFVFGYGSLMWRPDFPFRRSAPASALGVSRRLCVWSAAYRGSRARPGLVFGLDRDAPEAETRGVLFEVSPADRRAVIAYLFQRELIYPIYEPAMTRVRTDAGLVQALAFVVDPTDPAYAGSAPPEMRVAAIRTGRGRAGWARDYLANALAGLREMGAPEPGLERELALADALPDRDPDRLFRLFDEAGRRRLDLVFQNGEEAGADETWRDRFKEGDGDAAGPLGESVPPPEDA